MRHHENETFQGVTVEFIGLPGAGKTTLCNELSSRLKSHGFLVSTRSEMNDWLSQQPQWLKSAWRFCYAVKFLPSLISAVDFILSIKPFGIDIARRLLRPHKALIAQEIFVSKKKPKLLLLDQAEIQQLWSLTVLSKRYDSFRLEKYISKLIQKKRHPSLYVYLYASPELSDSRVSDREHGDSRFENMERASRIVLFNQSQYILDELVTDLAKLGKKVVRLDAAIEIDENLALLERAITQHSSG